MSFVANIWTFSEVGGSFGYFVDIWIVTFWSFILTYKVAINYELIINYPSENAFCWKNDEIDDDELYFKNLGKKDKKRTLAV